MTKRAASVTSSESTSAAISQLVEANLRLVVSYAHRFQGCGLSLIDLIHAGNIGLIEAAHRFDSSRDAAFISFASWWVRQAMIHAIADRASAHPMPASVLATPTVNRVASFVLAASEVAGELAELAEFIDMDEVDGLDLDETFEEIQSRANGAPRQADRLRSHLN